jgi:hypothetical protein
MPEHCALVIPANRSLEGSSHYIPARLVALQRSWKQIKGYGLPHVLHVPPMRTIVDCSADIDVWHQHFAQRYSTDYSDNANDANM